MQNHYSGRTNEFNGIEYLTVPLTSIPMMICVVYIYIYIYTTYITYKYIYNTYICIHTISVTLMESLKLSNFYTILGHCNKILNTHTTQVHIIYYYYYTNNVCTRRRYTKFNKFNKTMQNGMYFFLVSVQIP